MSINTGICLSVIVLAATTVAASAADLEFFKSPPPIVTPAGPQTLTGDWFGQGPAMRAAGLDFRLEWSQFYQGLLRGEGDKTWRYGGKWDALVRADLSRLGFWNGLSVTGQGQFNYGHSVNGIGGTLLPVNTALMFPGIEGADRSDIMALFATQNFGDLVALRVGKLNLLEFPRATPLRGGGGIDTFWNINLAAPITGLIPPTLNGAMLGINTQPVSFSFMVFDPQDATNRPLFTDLFENGISFMGTATLQTTIAGLTGFYGIRALYSTREGPDFSEVIRPPGTPVNTKQGSYYVGASFQQNLIQDPSNPARGWGVFGEITTADGNPNPLEWSTHVGIGGTALIPGRPDDRFGIAYFRFGFSSVLKNAVAPVFNLEDESGVEVFYNVAVTPWFRVTANLQFIRPASGNSPDDIFAGLGTYVRF